MLLNMINVDEVGEAQDINMGRFAGLNFCIYFKSTAKVSP